MKTVICPTVTARNAEEYGQQMAKLAPFVKRVHIDLADGVFTHVKLTPIKDVWWPGGVQADVHVMYQQPFKHTKELLALGPQLIVVHAEADGDFLAFADTVHAAGVAVGVALKPETMPQVIEPALDFIDHVLIFSGHLGHFGGQADTHLLTKVLYLKRQKPSLEIGWDGGINHKNAAVLAAGGVNVLNTGGFIQHAPNPHAAYEMLEEHVRLLSHHHRRV
jgi:ribulose-phosphate 3-epimerase